MAAGEMKWFRQGLMDLGNKIHDLDGDDWRLGIVTDATVPAISTAAPHWGGSGTTDFSANEVDATETAYTGPIALSTETWQLMTGGAEMLAAKVVIAQDAAGPADIAYGIVFNNTDANKRAIGWVEIDAAGAASLVTGPIEIRWNGVDGTGRMFSLVQS
jgi:hypothetical protein